MRAFGLQILATVTTFLIILIQFHAAEGGEEEASTPKY